jgi:hypothetical protein
MISPQPTEVLTVDPRSELAGVPCRSARTSIILAALESSREQTRVDRCRVFQLFGRVLELLQAMNVDCRSSVEVIFTASGPLLYRSPRWH